MFVNFGVIVGDRVRFFSTGSGSLGVEYLLLPFGGQKLVGSGHLERDGLRHDGRGVRGQKHLSLGEGYR